MKLKKVLSICKTNGLYYLYERIDRSGEITQWLGDGYALYPLDGLPILDEESFCAVFDITGKQREKILFRHERLPEHLNVEDVAAGDKLVREYETTFINGGLRLKPLKTNNGVTFIRSLYLSPLARTIRLGTAIWMYAKVPIPNPAIISSPFRLKLTTAPIRWHSSIFRMTWR